MHALSIPTWVIHISSVVEWLAAIWLIWTYGEVSRNHAWWGLSIAMLPALVSAMCACTWHFFDNAASLEWLVTLQASMTVVGNCTQMAAAWWLWRSTNLATPVNKPLSLNALLPLPVLLLLLPGVFPIAKETLFAVSLFPYLGFLWFLTRSRQTPRLALIGFYALLVFVAVTIPAGIYAKTAYGANLADVDWLHGGAESLLTLSNILVVLGFRQGIIDCRSVPESQT
jgi:Protein of unknown function (DUF3593)/Protein of unknown function (DUF2499)